MSDSPQSSSVFQLSPAVSPSLAIACTTGGFKGIFVHGALSALAAGMIAVYEYGKAKGREFL